MKTLFSDAIDAFVFSPPHITPPRRDFAAAATMAPLRFSLILLRRITPPLLIRQPAPPPPTPAAAMPDADADMPLFTPMPPLMAAYAAFAAAAAAFVFCYAGCQMPFLRHATPCAAAFRDAISPPPISPAGGCHCQRISPCHAAIASFGGAEADATR